MPSACRAASKREPRGTFAGLPAPDDEQQPTLAVLLLAERESDTRADRVWADTSVSSIASVSALATDPLAWARAR
jgi:hypothetical protein